MRKLRFSICLLLLVFFIVNFSAAQTVYITNTGKKYHTTSCHYLRLSKSAIKLQDALKRNYTACLVCRPVTQVSEKNPIVNKFNDGVLYRDTSAEDLNIQSVSATQCTGTTKAGNRCRRMTRSARGRCYQH